MTRRMWIAVLVAFALFISVEIVLFTSYQHENDQNIINIQERLDNRELLNLSANETLELEGKMALKQNLWAVIWNFLGTTAFDKVTLGLLLVVVMAAIGGIFKIDNAIEEKVRNDRQKRIDAQTKCIEKTAEMWNELYCIASEVRFYDRKIVEKLKNTKDEKNTKKTIVEILACLENFASKAEDVVNMWQFMFPRLPVIGNELKREKIREYKKDWKTDHGGKSTKESNQEIEKKLNLDELKPSTLILSYANVLYNAASSVAYFILQDDKSIDIKTLQHSLGVIQDVIKSLAHHPILSLLKNAVEPLDGHKLDINGENTKERIKFYLNRMHQSVMVLKKWEYENPPLSIMKENKAYITFKNEADNFIAWIKSQTELKESKEKEKAGEKSIYDNLRVSFGKAIDDVRDWSKNLVESQESKAKKRVEEENEKKKKMNEMYNNLKTSFDKMMKEKPDIIEKWEFKYTDEYLRNLANNLAFNAITRELKDRVMWSEIPKDDTKKDS